MGRKQRRELEAKCDDLALELNRAIAMHNLHRDHFALVVNVQVVTHNRKIDKDAQLSWSAITDG